VSSYPRNEQIAALPTEALAAYAAVRTVFEAAPLQGLLRIPDPRGVHQLFSSALSESCSRSACAFPMMSNASEWSPTGIQATRSGRGAFPTRRTQQTTLNGSDDSPIAGNQPHCPGLPHPVRGPIRSRETNTGPLGAGSHPSHHSAQLRTRRQYSACILG
jgi:hypothetical protein